MDHVGGMIRNLTDKTDISNEISPRLYLKDHVSSCHDFCKYGSKHDSILAKGNERVPTHLTISKNPDVDCSPKRLGTAKVRQKGERCRLKTAFQTEENVSWDSGINCVTHSQHSDASSELIECMSEESVNMKSRTPSPFSKSILTFEHNNVFLEDGSLEESVVMVSEAAPSTFDEIISIDGMPWAWSDGSSDESVVMDLESPLSALDSMTCTQISHDTELQGSSVEFGVTTQKIISPASSNEAKGCSNSRNLKQETAGTLRKSMKSTTSISSKVQKPVNSLKVDEKQKRELPMLRSSLPVRTSLLGRVKAKKKVDEVMEPGIINEKSPTLDRTVKSVIPKKAGVIKGSATSLSPLIIKKKTLSPPKTIRSSSEPAVLLKTKSLVLKYNPPIIVSGGITSQSSKTVSEMGREKVLKQIGPSLAHKSSIYCSPGLNYPKLRSVKNQVDAGKVDEIKEKTLHALEQKLVGVALKSAEQKQLKLRSQQPSKTLSFRSSMPSSTLVLSSSKEENDGSQLTIKDGGGSIKAQIGGVNGRISVYDYKRIQKRTPNVSMEDKSLSPGKLSSGTSSSLSSLSCSALVSSYSKEESDGSKLIKNDFLGSKKTQIDEGKGRALFFDYKKIPKRTSNICMEDKSLSPGKLSLRTSSSRSSLSCSALVSSSSKQESVESKLIIGSKKTQIDEGKERTPYFDYNRIQKRTKNVSPENKSLSSEMMSFRRGKEVSLQKVNTGERRLRFLQEKSASNAENFEGEIRKNTFRKSKELTTASSPTQSLSSPVVVLKHHDVQEKNTQALFNDIIEETANKLVEIKKSKVKALVGAFESIISCQE